MAKIWDFWHKDKHYGNVLYKRAIGVFPEMESSKALARQVKTCLKPGDSLLDVGCGPGHYLRSLRREIRIPFTYTGIDATRNYISLARKAFPTTKATSFHVGDIFRLSLRDKSHSIVTCNNVLLHLPSIKKPLHELIRVAKRIVLIRTLIGDHSFRILDVKVLGDEFKPNGEPKQFHYHNIYSRQYIAHLLAREPRVSHFEFAEDHAFAPSAIENSADQHKGLSATRILGDWQRNGYILQPWTFLKLVLH